MDFPMDRVATLFFTFALIHTFSVKKFQALALKYRNGSVQENLFHALGEIEIVIGLWAGMFIFYWMFSSGAEPAVTYLNSRNFTEPIFVFVIMAVASTKPILFFANKVLHFLSGLLPMQKTRALVFSLLFIGPLLGSFITEPAAMTVTALLLKACFFDLKPSNKLKYFVLGVLFVNISVGGTLTPYAAPPILMVARTWGWDFSYVMTYFGWKAIATCLVNAGLVLVFGWKELAALNPSTHKKNEPTPWFLILFHLLFLSAIVVFHANTVLSMGLFLFFLGIHSITQEYQSPLKLKESLLVAFFLGGLVILGGLQNWWLEPVLSSLSEIKLFFSACFLTAVVDNAALTYLGSQVPNLTESAKYFLVAGSVVGGGLTVIANAPNPAGFSLLQSSFGKKGISPLGLLASAFFPTLIAILFFLKF